MQTPEIFFGAKCLYSLADISVANTEPPLTQSLTEVELKGVIDDPYIVDLPCHTVAVERGVKETTGAALKSADPLQRDGINFQIMESRKKNKMTVTKKVLGDLKS